MMKLKKRIQSKMMMATMILIMKKIIVIGINRLKKYMVTIATWT